MVRKSAVIFFHKNIQKLYKKHWIDKCVVSVLDQSFQDFDIFEINYGNEDYSILENKDKKHHNHFFFKKNFPTHVEAMVFLLNICFIDNNYDYVFNTNLDDYYNKDRFIEQIKCCEDGYILNSTLWHYFREDTDYQEKQGLVFQFGTLGVTGEKYASVSSVKDQLNKKNNVINHSGVCYSRKFWEGLDKYDNKLRYRNDKPFEDLTLWTRAVNAGHKITVIEKDLISYRLHNNQIGNQNSKDNENADKGFLEPDYTPTRYGIFTKILKNNINDLVEFLKSVSKQVMKHQPKTLFVFTDDVESLKDYFKNFNHKYIIIPNQSIQDYISNERTIVEILCDKKLKVDFNKNLSIDENNLSKFLI